MATVLIPAFESWLRNTRLPTPYPGNITQFVGDYQNTPTDVRCTQGSSN